MKVVLTIFISEIILSTGYGFGHELAAEPSPIPAMVYDCRRLTASATLINCTCLQGNDIWTCAFPAHRERNKK